MATAVNFAISRERGEQLRALAKHHGTPINELLEKWILRDITAQGLPDAIPGMDVVTVVDEKTGDRFIHLSIAPLPTVRMSALEAHRIADGINDVAFVGGVRAFRTEAGDSMMIFRVGRGVAIEAYADGDEGRQRRATTYSVVVDLARQLRRAAGHTEA